ncbi:MAG: response regulator [Eubacterium sp.]|nr:response regulator [Eubacterium sp.]
MIKSALVISQAESFILRGILMKLNGIGVSTEFAKMDSTDIKAKEDSSDMIVLYMEDYVYECQEELKYIHDMCSIKDKMITLIGSKNEYDFALKTFDENRVFAWFERPLDMDAFLKKFQTTSVDMEMEARKKSILIIDDDLDYMHMIREWLKDGYKVSMANSGLQGITWLAKNKVDLILLDYEMPVTSGPQVLEMLKSEKETKNIPVIFLTGKDDRGSIMKVLSLKPNGYLLKSITRDELTNKLKSFFTTGKV